MALVGTLLSLNLWWYTSHASGTYLYPTLLNPDADRSWSGTLWLLDLPGGAQSANYKDMAYSYLMWAAMPFLRATGIVMPLLVNAFAILMTIVLTGSLCVRVINERGRATRQRIGLWGMAACACVFYITASGTILLKDALVILAVTAAVRASLGSEHSHGQSRFRLPVCLVIWTVAMVILAMLRNACVPMLIIFMLIVHGQGSTRRPALVTIYMLIWGAICGAYTSMWLGTEVVSQVTAVDSAAANSSYLLAPDHHRAFGALMGSQGDFISWPLWRKVLYMPVAVILQFFIPLPWNFESTASFGPSMYVARMGFGWYVVAGLVVYYLVFLMWRHGGRALRWMTILGVLMWMSPAYAFMGTVSRYALSFIPMLVPAAVYAVVRDRRRTRFDLWVQWWILAVVVGLVIIYVLQHTLS